MLLLGAGSARAETLEVAGLRQPARIQVDKWGVPHIYAGDSGDLYFVQGFNAARDRLAQIDLWRRRGLGRMSAVFCTAATWTRNGRLTAAMRAK
jgi:penicillin amidase